MGKRRWVTMWVALGTLFFFTNMRAAMADDVAWMASHQDGACTAAAVSGNGGGGGCGFLGWDCISHFMQSGLGTTLWGVLTVGGIMVGLAFVAGLAPFVLAAAAMTVAIGISVVEVGALVSELRSTY